MTDEEFKALKRSVEEKRQAALIAKGQLEANQQALDNLTGEVERLFGTRDLGAVQKRLGKLDAEIDALFTKAQEAIAAV